ncbi:hypothetical protein YB2330_005011 [Saitoella coloradoensis]
MFTPIHSFVGGLLLFSSVSNFELLNGRVLGCSGILREYVWGDHAPWRAASLLGMAVGTLATKLLAPSYLQSALTVPTTIPLLGGLTGALLAGALVGAGTKLANGCTSGHMLCGLARLSPRSIAATVALFASSIATTYFVGSAPSSSTPLYQPLWPTPAEQRALIGLYALAVITFQSIRAVGAAYKASEPTKAVLRNVASFASGLFFSLGLIVSGMVHPTKTLGFLNITDLHNWDPSLMMIVLGGVLPNAIHYFRTIKSLKAPILDSKWWTSQGGAIDVKLVVGALIFGVGWGLRGVCPGPAVVQAVGNAGVETLGFVAAFLLGSKLV